MSLPNVVCIKAGAKYPAEYVNRLRSMVSRHLSSPYRFVCLTDDPYGVEGETIPLDSELQGWWHKLTLFRPDPYGMKGKILFLDLDSVIVGSLDEMLMDVKFCIIQDFIYQAKHNSSVFLLEAGALPHVWDRVNPHVMMRMHGDQDWITRQVPHPQLWPASWCLSYRLQARAGYPRDAKVICFHGSPKPHECNGWVAEHWR